MKFRFSYDITLTSSQYESSLNLFDPVVCRVYYNLHELPVPGVTL